MRVLKWMLERIEGKAAEGDEHLFGITPRYEDMHWDGLDFGRDKYEKITSIDNSAWEDELKLHAELFDKLRHKLPPELEAAKDKLEQRLKA
jgi:phosphoenolpyruvate carboxykinase (GTP)